MKSGFHRNKNLSHLEMGFLIPVKVSIMPLISGGNPSLIEWSLFSPLEVLSLWSLYFLSEQTDILMLCAANSLHFLGILLKILCDWLEQKSNSDLFVIFSFIYLKTLTPCGGAAPWQLLCWAWPRCQLANYVGYVGVLVRRQHDTALISHVATLTLHSTPLH